MVGEAVPADLNDPALGSLPEDYLKTASKARPSNIALGQAQCGFPKRRFAVMLRLPLGQRHGLAFPITLTSMQ